MDAHICDWLAVRLLNRHKLKQARVKGTLSEAEVLRVEVLRSALAHPDLRAVWWAPPCGAASLARCIPLEIPNAPRPLRTLEPPDGVENLTPVEQARVDAANCLYHALADSVKETIKRGIIHIVDNPRGSLFWRTTAWSRIRDLFNYTSFQACAYGGRRPKHTALAFTHPAFAKFCRSCPNCSDHLPWGLSDSGWATSEEAVYPCLFANIAAPLQHFSRPSPDINYPVVPEQACRGCQSLVTSFQATAPHGKTRCPVALPESCQCELRVLPAGGIPYSPSEFIEAALSVGHPGLAASDLPGPLRMPSEARKQTERLAKERANLIRQWASRAHALEEDERALKQSLRPEVAKILAPKRLFFGDSCSV